MIATVAELKHVEERCEKAEREANRLRAENKKLESMIEEQERIYVRFANLVKEAVDSITLYGHPEWDALRRYMEGYLR